MRPEAIRVLLVEDDEDDFVLTKELLLEIKRSRFALEWAKTYDAGLELIGRQAHDVYLLDYRLGGHDGLQLLREAVTRGCQAPLILLTGQADGEVDLEAMAAGAADYLVKGRIDATLLERSIRYALERKRAQDALKASQEYARNLIESSLDMIIASDQHGDVTEFNRAAQATFGYRPEEIIGRPFQVLYSDPSHATRVLADVLKNGKCAREIITVRKDGRTFECLLSSSVVRDARGNVVGAMGIYRDVTGLKRAEREIEKLAAFPRENPNPVMECALDGSLNYYNQAALNLAEYVGKARPEELLPPGTPLIVQECLGAGKSRLGLETTLNKRIISWSFFPILTTQVVHCYAEDITEHRRAEELIRASLKEKEVMLKEIHHRVKNNLQVVSGLLQLQSAYIKDPQALQIFNESQSRIRSMALIHEALYQSKDLAKIDFHSYLRKVTDHLFRSFDATARQLTLKVEAEGIFLDVNKAVPCGLIIHELVSNSLKYAFPSGRDGEILVQLRLDAAQQLALIVRDNGVGLPAGWDPQLTKTLGWRLVTILTKQIGGVVEVQSTAGVEVKITFGPG